MKVCFAGVLKAARLLFSGRLVAFASRLQVQTHTLLDFRASSAPCRLSFSASFAPRYCGKLGQRNSGCSSAHRKKITQSVSLVSLDRDFHQMVWMLARL